MEPEQITETQHTTRCQRRFTVIHHSGLGFQRANEAARETARSKRRDRILLSPDDIIARGDFRQPA